MIPTSFFFSLCAGGRAMNCIIFRCDLVSIIAGIGCGIAWPGVFGDCTSRTLGRARNKRREDAAYGMNSI